MGTLTELGVKSAKEGMHGDGDGLMLVVRASGRKSWLLRYQMKGARRDMGLGRYPEFGLKEARQRALDARRLIGGGSRPYRGAAGRPEGRQADSDLRRDRCARHRRRPGENDQREGQVPVGAPSWPGLFRPASRPARA